MGDMLGKGGGGEGGRGGGHNDLSMLSCNLLENTLIRCVIVERSVMVGGV